MEIKFVVPRKGLHRKQSINSIDFVSISARPSTQNKITINNVNVGRSHLPVELGIFNYVQEKTDTIPLANTHTTALVIGLVGTHPCTHTSILILFIGLH